jgi:hypothetical protein
MLWLAGRQAQDLLWQGEGQIDPIKQSASQLVLYRIASLSVLAVDH